MTEEDHLGSQADNAASIIMMKQVAESLPTEYAEVLEQIIIDWRTHTLPVCDPSAID
jgi:hypothetical protein